MPRTQVPGARGIGIHLGNKGSFNNKKSIHIILYKYVHIIITDATK